MRAAVAGWLPKFDVGLLWLNSLQAPTRDGCGWPASRLQWVQVWHDLPLASDALKALTAACGLHGNQLVKQKCDCLPAVQAGQAAAKRC